MSEVYNLYPVPIAKILHLVLFSRHFVRHVY